MIRSRSSRHSLILVSGVATVTLMVLPLGAAAAATPATAPFVRCGTTIAADRPIATRMARDITTRLHETSSIVGLEVTDSQTGITCTFRSKFRVYSASVVKATIL